MIPYEVKVDGEVIGVFHTPNPISNAEEKLIKDLYSETRMIDANQIEVRKR